MSARRSGCLLVALSLAGCVSSLDESVLEPGEALERTAVQERAAIHELMCQRRDHAACWTGRNGRSPEVTRAEDEAVLDAAERRSSSPLLADAEARACTGVAPLDRDVSPFLEGPDVRAVSPLREGGRTLGVRVVFRRVPGMSASWLEHLLACHAARAAAMGSAAPEMPYGPFPQAGDRLTVTAEREDLVVRVTSEDPAVAGALAARGLRMKVGPAR